MSDSLLAVGAASGGILATRDATRLDVDPNALAALVTSGALVHVRRGAYVLGALWRETTQEARLALRTRAVMRARGAANEAATHQSALALHRLPLHGCPVDVVDLAGDVTRVRRRAGLRIHPADPRLHLVEGTGWRAVDVDGALVQLALRDGRDPFVVAADAALARGLTSLESLLATTGNLAESTREVVRTRRWIDLLDRASESPGESRTRLALHDFGHDLRSQVRITDATGLVVARVDLLVGRWVVVEFDGLVKYEGSQGREALAAEKVREDLLRSLGYEVVRIVWADLARPGRIDALVRAAQARATLRHGGSSA